MEDIERSTQPTVPPVPETPDTPKPERKLQSRLSKIALCLLISLAALSATLYVYDRWYAQKIVAVDLKGYITLQRYKYKDGKINDEDLRKAFDKLELEMNAIPKNRVVIMADTTIRNAEVFKLGHEEELKQYDELLRRSLQGNPAVQEQ